MNSYPQYQKKIVPYLDGSMSPSEKAEFEAFVSTHPDFESQIRHKENEVELLRKMIPHAAPTEDSLESLENEMRTSIFNLLKEEPTSVWGSIANKWEEWINR